jgi:hypothetical protein
MKEFEVFSFGNGRVWTLKDISCVQRCHDIIIICLLWKKSLGELDLDNLLGKKSFKVQIALARYTYIYITSFR